MLSNLSVPALLLILSFVVGEENEEPDRFVEIRPWLSLGPISMPAAAFDKTTVDQAAATALLNAPILEIDSADTRRGNVIPAPGTEPVRWRERDVPFFASGNTLKVAWAATHLVTRSFVEVEVSFMSFQTLKIYLDGEEVSSKSTLEEAGPVDGGTVETKLKLDPGSHLLVVKTVFSPEGSEKWYVNGKIRTVSPDEALPTITIDPTHRVEIDDLLDTETVSWLKVSPSGLHVALGMREPEVPADFSRQWVEIREIDSGEVVRTTRGVGNQGDFDWRPQSDQYSFTRRDGDRATVYLADMAGKTEAILKELEHASSTRWSPDGKSLFYAVTEKDDDEDLGLKRMRGLTDRWPGHRNRIHLYQAFVNQGVTRQITGGSYRVTLQDIRPDGRHLLFSRTRYGQAERPFYNTELLELDLTTLDARALTEAAPLNAAYYGPGNQIIVQSGPGFAISHGLVAETQAAANDYEGELYAQNDDGEWNWLTADFDPSVDRSVYSEVDGMLYILATDRSYRSLFRADSGASTFKELPCGVDSVAQFSMSDLAPVIAFSGSSANVPPGVFLLDTDNDAAEDAAEARQLFVPGASTWNDVVFGDVRDFPVTLENGETLDGRVYLPPDLDPNRKYPAIVYYYGGASPVTRNFGGRYPKNLWAAHDYVVFTLNPSGAAGYGREFSDRHVNNWGKSVSDEIVEGTRVFLEAHPFVDNKRVGCIGASYGGFMTMLLVAETDLYAAAIAHAGISSLSSYWGEGHWGYLYSAVATADSYPWNRPDIYVDQSPLFKADRIHTPLLLLHGSSDTNVPVGESEQMYTALVTLGRDVEFVRVAGENHHILDYPKRKRWMKTILAWYDWKLKGEEAWWDELFGEKDD